MNTGTKFKNSGASLLPTAVASILAACAATSLRPAGAVDARPRLASLRANPVLASRAPLAAHAAHAAIRVAEQPGADSQHLLGLQSLSKAQHRPARAQTRLAEEQRPEFRAASTKAYLGADTHELDLALRQTALAKAEGAELALAATSARAETDAANRAAASDEQASDARREAERAELAASISRQQTAERQPKIDLLQARVTGSGLEVTLVGLALFR